MSLFIILFFTFISTVVGGLIALRFSDRLHIILGFTAGVLLSIVSFDLLPEIVAITGSVGMPFIYPMMALVTGFLLFHILEKGLLIHHSHEDSYGQHHHPSVGSFSAAALIVHAFLDGASIGLAFQISELTGIAVAIAVLAHNFADGLNTVSLMLAHKNSKKKALAFVVVGACAPVLGGLSTLFFSLSEKALVIYFGFFAGVLLYICAADILPEAHSKKSSWMTVLSTILGTIFIYFVLGFIHH